MTVVSHNEGGRGGIIGFFFHFFNPFPDVAGYIRHETFFLWHHFLQWLHEIGSAKAERAGQGEVGGCTRRVQTAWLSLGSALKMPWLALSGPLLSSYAQPGWENSPLALHGAHFRRGSIYPSLGERLPAECHDYCQLVNGWVWFESRTCRRCL